MSLAYKSARRASILVPEEKLSFGFKKIPKNAENVISVPNIPEEKLYTFDTKVVELKEIPCRKHKEKEEIEVEEEEEEEEEEAKPACGLGYLNYNQLGYYPQQHVNRQFAVTQFEATEPEAPCEKESTPEIGSCGYKPGRIVNNSNNDDNNGYAGSDDDVYGYEG